MVAESKVNNRR